MCLCVYCVCSDFRCAGLPRLLQWTRGLPSSYLVIFIIRFIQGSSIGCLEEEQKSSGLSGPCEIPWHSGSPLSRDSTASQGLLRIPCLPWPMVTLGQRPSCQSQGQSGSFSKSRAKGPGTLPWALVKLWGAPGSRIPGVTAAQCGARQGRFPGGGST